MKKTALAGRCGIYCGACDFYLAIENPEIKPDLSRAISVDEKDIHCTGCGDLDDTSWGMGCKTAACCKENQVEYCFECNEFPCQELKKMASDDYPHHHSAIENLKQMKQNGIPEWLEQQANRWSCPNCGKEFSWYREHCRKCGSKVKSCREGA